MEPKELYEHLDVGNRLIITDSRQIVPGCVFVALRGDAFNGNDFAEQAIAQGATFAIVDDKKVPTEEKFIHVADALKTLQDLAAHHRSLFSIPIIVIGGSNGKTTTKELIAAVLGTKFRIATTKGNFNNHIGVPLSLFSITSETEIAVIEIGANHPGEHELLCNIVKPTHALVTNNGKDHLEGFGSYEGVCKANAEIYEHIRATDGHVFVSSLHDRLVQDSNEISRSLYGYKKTDDYAFASHTSGMYAAVEYDHAIIRSQLVGIYNEENIMAAAAVGLFFNVPISMIQSAIENYVPTLMRSQIVEQGNTNWIIDCYNANPSSMELSIQSFMKTAAAPRAVILGDMFEMGEYAAKEHAGMVDLVRALPIKRKILIGKEFIQAVVGESDIVVFETAEQAKEYIQTLDWNGFSILVKGSRGMKLETALPFSLNK